MRIGKLEVYTQRNFTGGFYHLSHYSGRMHSLAAGPVMLVIYWRSNPNEESANE